MSRVFSARFIRLGLLVAILALTSTLRAQVYEGRELVKAELLANTSAVVPGKSFLVGLHLRMVPGWHTYWKFPGDAGIPTEIKWKLPAGWKAGEIQWPTPLKIDEPGDIQIYGYHDEVLLMQEITPRSAIADPTVKLAAEVNWLVCEKICIPGGATLTLDLPVGAQASPANEQLFARYQRALPQSWPDSSVASVSWTRAPATLTLRVKSAALANYPAVDFLPLPGEKVVVGHPAAQHQADGISFTIPIDTADAGLAAIPGVIVFGQANSAERNAWELRGEKRTAAASLTRPTKAPDGFARLLLYGFLGGLILNLMPCVLPVISLKIFGFIQHAGQSRRKIFLSGLSFVAGIFVWFLALALLLIVLKNAGHEITWALQFTNPYFVVGMSVLVLVFALNLFGVFEISLPQTATRGLLGWTAREGDAGSFFQGIFATALATPCTAPYLGTALGFALTQSPGIIFLMFIAIAAGMSAPYLILSAQPAWLKFLPKPGPWMERIKQLMGFLLIATLLFLLAVLGAQRGVEAIVWTGAFLLVVSIVCWMKGAFVTPLASATSRTLALVGMLVLLLAGGGYFLGEKFAHTSLQTVAATENGWQPFTPERLQAARNAGRTVFVDFTAAWCVTCKFNEGAVLESSDVRAAFERRGIVKLKADWTNGDPVITKMLKQFGRVGVPLYVLYPAGESEPIILPELLTKNIVLEKLETIAPQVARK
ncbi:MAG: protein-disulfide reductase DsbD family protein [Chthoniobacterales bacterium]